MSDDIIVGVLFGMTRRIVLPAHVSLPAPPVPLVAAAVALGLLIVEAHRSAGRRIRRQGHGRTAPPL